MLREEEALDAADDTYWTGTQEAYILFCTSAALTINEYRNAERLLEDALSFLAKYAGGVKSVLERKAPQALTHSMDRADKRSGPFQSYWPWRSYMQHDARIDYSRV